MFTVGEMMDMQKAMLEKYSEQWEHYSPEAGKNHLLWMIGEVGEVIDIIKKNGSEAACADPKLRSHLVEEMVDVMMFYTDVLLCFGISEEEFKEAYQRKFQRNLSRW